MITFISLGNLGRLGNQMFQLASTFGIGKRLGYEVKFSREIVTGGSPESPDSYLGCKLYECFDIPESLLLPHSDILYKIKFRYNEGDFRYNPETESLVPDIDLYGYFQTEKYFKEYRKEILEIFKFKKEISSKANQLLEVRDNYVSVHVRRGDYLNSPEHHPLLSNDYYENSMKEFPSDSIFCFFSDDLDWCKQNFKGDNFLFVKTGSPYCDLFLMSKFKNHIIANSSFSWWGSWLSDSEKTIAPSTWFGHNLKKDTTDIYCKNWIIV
jgi:hypothetical protein